MKTSPKVKICGLKRLQDLLFAKTLGADYYGFILYEKSQRYISFNELKLIIDSVPMGDCVFVDVMPSEDKIKQMKDIGCQNFQIHTYEETNYSEYETYVRLLDRKSIWLAPQVSDLNKFDEALNEFSDTFLIDTYSNQQVGGTGMIGDWNGFKQLQSKFSKKQWILAGGLNPKNIKECLYASEANFIDINSGVEEAPGVKSAESLKHLFNQL